MDDNWNDGFTIFNLHLDNDSFLKVLPLADSTAKLWCLVNFENRHLGHPQ